MRPILSVCLALLSAGLSCPLAAQTDGTATGTSATGNETQQAAFAFTVDSAEAVSPSQFALIDLGTDMAPLGLATDGTVTLVDYWDSSQPFRWRKGTVSYLKAPDTIYRYSTQTRTPLSYYNPGSGQGSLTLSGMIVSSAADEKTAIVQKNGFNVEGRYQETVAVCWPVGVDDAPWVIRGADVDYPNAYYGDSWSPMIKSSAVVQAIANNGEVWVDVLGQTVPQIYAAGALVGNAFAADQLTDVYTAPDSNFDRTVGTYELTVDGVNSSRQAIGSYTSVSEETKYYVGSPANPVAWIPLAINDAGLVLGDEPDGNEPYLFGAVLPHADAYAADTLQSIAGYSANAPFVYDGTVKHYLAKDDVATSFRLIGLDEDGNVYGSFYEWFYVVWVAKPTDWGLSEDTPAYTPIAWETPALPTDYVLPYPYYSLPPGARRIELGIVYKIADDGTTSLHGIVLTPAQLRVDVDRDGIIETTNLSTNPDRLLAENGLPYYFWTNDDDDSGDTGGTDIPGQAAGSADGANATVDGVRDLVDFFPVHLDIAKLLAVLPPANGFTYKLRHATGVLAYVPTDLTPATAGDYLRNATTAASLGQAATLPVTADGVTLTTDFLNAIATDGKGVILVEASSPTEYPLQLAVADSAGNCLAYLDLPLSISGVESLYRRANLVQASRMDVEEGAQGRTAAFNYPDELCNDQWFVFVHGYNVDQQESRGAQSELFKRLWWSGSRAKFVGVTWYGYESKTSLGFSPDYHANVVHAFEASQALADYLATLSPTGTGMNVAAHSLGNMVVSSAISDHSAQVKNYFLLDAAVASEAYSSDERQTPDATATMAHSEWTTEKGGTFLSTLWASEWHSLAATGDERGQLTWSGRFTPVSGVNYYNFYSSGEEVLAEHTGNMPSLTGILFGELGRAVWNHLFHSDDPNGRYAWAYQEKLKGRTLSDRILGSSFGGWGFNSVAFTKTAGLSGLSLAPKDMTPSDAASVYGALSPAELPATLLAVPFFKPGDDDNRLESWSSASLCHVDNLGSLYTTDGSEVASRQRDRLLAQMIPALSLATGQHAVGDFTPPNSVSRNLDLNGMKTGWPTGRQASTETKDRWLHNDMRQVAYLYTYNLFNKIVEFGELKQ